MVDCACGRNFKSDAALEQHRTDKAKINHVCSPSSQSTTKIFPTPRRRDGWLWKSVRRRHQPVQDIQYTRLQASSTPVTSAAPYDLICTYNWAECAEASVRIPGHAPKWQDVPLPITLQPDKGVFFVDQNAARIPKYPFEPMFQAAAVMNPQFTFDDVDIVVNRNSLRKLLDFSCGHSLDSFRLSLLMVNNTLFIERNERSARELLTGSNQRGWGHNFEKTFTKFPVGEDESSGHHRVLCYPLGHMRCAVRFEVDACYEANVKEDTHVESLLLRLGGLSISSSTNDKLQSSKPASHLGTSVVMPQSTAAELKTTQKSKTLSSCLPQLWFGRTPWLIIGKHTKGTFESVKITDAAASFEQWETRQQAALQKMVTILDRLRGAVRRNGGRNCIAIYEKSSDSKVIKIFGSMENRRPLPDDCIARFWATPTPGS